MAMISCRHSGPRPKTYKAFIVDLPDEVSPEEAQKRYEEYLSSYWGSARKAHFQQIKEKPE